MRMVDIIQKKKAGQPLTAEEIRFFIKGYTAGSIPDYQAAALLMAICLRGMTDRETAELTQAMVRSGNTVDLTRFGTLSADKHSTGGVGDKTTLIVAPIVAALGGKVAKMSGRGLGHTGGTVDKLESIPGYRTTLSADEFLRQVDTVGVAVIGQSGNLTPADKQLYALRDVTATVDSIPLITSSIMSKKLAAGAHTIVLDVKVGSGAFMKTPEDAAALAESMVRIGRQCGRQTAAVLSNMDAPLGYAVGNALEVQEAVEVLQGRCRGDLREVSVTLAAAMVGLVHSWDADESLRRVNAVLDSGAAFAKMTEWIAAQGGDPRYLEQPSRFIPAADCREVTASHSGYITAMDTERIGAVSVQLGAGRAAKGESIDPAAGIRLYKKTGDAVTAGEPLGILYSNRPETLAPAAEAYAAAVAIGAEKPSPRPLIYQIIR